MKWSDLKYWNSGEYQVIREKLSDLTKAKIKYNPRREDLFAALKATPFDKVSVVILGQDPYPDPELATGVAFSIPEGKTFPPTLKMIFKEYQNDLHYELPKSGDLKKWTDQGVLLWNVIPSCEAWKSMSHDWDEWTYLTQEIVSNVQSRGVVFAALGSIPAGYLKHVAEPSKTIQTSHPSPRGLMNSKNPFIGSRIFSTINDYLRQLKKPTIDWRLE